jgi:hypothetical protein
MELKKFLLAGYETILHFFSVFVTEWYTPNKSVCIINSWLEDVM